MENSVEDMKMIERIKQDSTFRERSLLRIIEKLQKENEELKADNYELNNRINDLLDNISVQKVKDKIEELKQKRKIHGNFIDKDENFNIESKISVLQELLESEEK